MRARATVPHGSSKCNPGSNANTDAKGWGHRHGGSNANTDAKGWGQTPTVMVAASRIEDRSGAAPRQLAAAPLSLVASFRVGQHHYPVIGK